MCVLFSPFSYNRDSEELMKWLDSAQQRMNFWKEQSLSVSQDLPTIRDNINSLFVSLLSYQLSYQVEMIYHDCQENDPFDFFFAFAMTRSCLQNMTQNGCMPQRYCITWMGNQEDRRPKKKLLSDS